LLHTSRDSPAHASTVVAKIIRATRTLHRFPFAGRIVPEFDDANLRERFVYSYRIIYQIEEHNVTVAAVIHGKRILTGALKED
jgi:plasmid stabilization system protein ParE